VNEFFDVRYFQLHAPPLGAVAADGVALWWMLCSMSLSPNVVAIISTWHNRSQLEWPS
jgi:hypothetical protein